MATRYDNFSVFMADVTAKTKGRVYTSYGDVWKYIIKILTDFGWAGFLALCAILVLGPFAFGAAVVSFALTPIGIALGVICAGGAGAALWAIYKQKKLPLAIKEVGNKYKAKYEAANSNSEIDRLFEQASDDLYRKLIQ